VAIEVEAVGGLPVSCEVSHAPPELFDVLEMHDFVVEVLSCNLRRCAGRIQPAIKDLPSVVEFE
jgi:hypothetical protein